VLAVLQVLKVELSATRPDGSAVESGSPVAGPVTLLATVTGPQGKPVDGRLDILFEHSYLSTVPAGSVAGGPTSYVLPLDTTQLLDGYAAAGTYAFTVDGKCGAQPCPDGAYVLRAEAVDAGDAHAAVSRAVVLDGTAPRSQVDMPAIAGLDHRVGTQSLRVG